MIRSRRRIISPPRRRCVERDPARIAAAARQPRCLRVSALANRGATPRSRRQRILRRVAQELGPTVIEAVAEFIDDDFAVAKLATVALMRSLLRHSRLRVSH